MDDQKTVRNYNITEESTLQLVTRCKPASKHHSSATGVSGKLSSKRPSSKRPIKPRRCDEGAKTIPVSGPLEHVLERIFRYIINFNVRGDEVLCSPVRVDMASLLSGDAFERVDNIWADHCEGKEVTHRWIYLSVNNMAWVTISPISTVHQFLRISPARSLNYQLTTVVP